MRIRETFVAYRNLTLAVGLFRSPIAENFDRYFVERITVAVFAVVFADL